MNNLAINGGAKAFELEAHNIPAWPPTYPETEELLLEIYRSHAWSFNGKYERKFDRLFAEYNNANYGVFMVQ